MGLLLGYLPAILNRGKDTKEDRTAYRENALVAAAPLSAAEFIFPHNLPVRIVLHNLLKTIWITILYPNFGSRLPLRDYSTIAHSLFFSSSFFINRYFLMRNEENRGRTVHDPTPVFPDGSSAVRRNLNGAWKLSLSDRVQWNR